MRKQLEQNTKLLDHLRSPVPLLSDEEFRSKYQFNRDAVKNRQKVRLQVVIQRLKTSQRAEPIEIKPSFQWTLLTLIRQRAFSWNPLCRIWFTITDVDDEEKLQWPEQEWKRLKQQRVTLEKADRTTPLLQRARHVCPPGDNRFHSAWILWSLALDIQRKYSLAMSKYISLEYETTETDRKNVERRLEELMIEFDKRELSAVFTNKRAWLIQRLLLPLGGLEISEWCGQTLDSHMLGIDMRWDTQTKQYVASCMSNCAEMAGFATQGYQVQDKKKDADEPNRFRDEKQAAAILNSDKEEKVLVVQKDPRVGVADMQAVFFDWMPQRDHGFDRLVKGFPESVRTTKEHDEMIAYLDEIQTLCAFAEFMDRHYLRKDEAHLQFLRTCVLLDSELELKQTTWINQEVGNGKGAWYQKSPAFIHISQKGFTVGCRQRRSPTFSKIKPAICVWYVLMMRLCDGKLTNQVQIEDWTKGDERVGGQQAPMIE
jgi:hypothetical protein